MFLVACFRALGTNPTATTMTSLARTLLVDIHTHVYLPRYVSFLRSRSVVPRIVKKGSEERLVILDDEPSGGRPVGPQVRV
jgi:aminocarboxymuconate-semialdehyde decarboxylase